MQCWQCGVNTRPGQKLCVYCGAKLTQDENSEFDVPAERGGSSGRDRAGGEREPRRSPAGGGSRGSRPPDDDGWSAAPEYTAGTDRNGQRERDDYYRPEREDMGGRGDPRAPRRTGGSSSRDPMEDPRAPRNLRGSASSGGRSSERGRGGYERQRYDDAEYEFDDYNPRDRANPRYLPRFDPESAEYDAVADQHRQSRVHPRRDDPRAARNPRDGWREEYDRDGRYAQERGGGYGAYGEVESAEYPASYDERAGRRDRGAGPSRGGRGADMPDQQGYGGGWDHYDNRNAGGLNAPAMGGPNAQGWNGGAWAPPGAGFPPPGVAAPMKKRGRGGLIAAVISLVVVLLLAGGGFLARGELLALLHHGSAGGTPAPRGFATYTPGPTPTVLSNYRLYSSAHALYVIEYPTSWTIQNQSPNSSGGYDYVDTFQQPDQRADLVVESAAAFNNASDTDIINGEVSGAKQSGFTYTQVGNDVMVSVGGESWTRRDYNVTSSNGVALRQAILVTHHAGRGYAIVLTSAASNFVQEDSGVFKTMLGTFRFTS